MSYNIVCQSPNAVSLSVLLQYLPGSICSVSYVLDHCLPGTYYSVYLCPTVVVASVLLH